MELSEFVTKTLVQIAKGVQGAQGDVSGAGGAVNPPHRYGTVIKTALWNEAPFGDVEFDVAIVTEDSKAGGGRVNVLGIGLGGELESRDKSVSRIRFKVPLSLPVHQGSKAK